MLSISLNGKWKLRGKEEASDSSDYIELVGNVPGSVQTDLADAGYLPRDLNLGMNITEAERYEGYEWWYERSFTAPSERERVFLVFEGVDCIAEYYLNERKLSSSENMLIPHEFEVGKYLSDGENTLTVHIRSSCKYLHEKDYDVKAMHAWGQPTETGLRRAPHTYGWDIMPRAVSAGIWRDVRLEVRDAVSFSQLYARAEADYCDVFYQLECAYSDFHGIELELTGSCGSDSYFNVKQKAEKSKTGKIYLPIKNPKKWYPLGYGDANVYDCVARIYQDGKPIHEECFSFGLRTVTLERTDTTGGVCGKFAFTVNGTEVMCRGTNWVPLNAFHHLDREKYDAALALVKDVGCNILRCWGGNVYEDHAFYDFCDRNGIMVWQDFSMACRSYPDDEKYAKLVEDEVRTVVRKLRNHPSIILWAGDNEIDVMSASAGIDPTKNNLSRSVIPHAVERNDMSRPYLASSPYVHSLSADRSKLSEQHLWGPRDYFKSDFYKNSPSHFVSEIGYHGCPSLESIKKFITPERVWPYKNNEEWILHSCDQNGNDSRVMLMEKQVRQLFGTVPAEPERYITASQISQAEADKFFIERIRSARPEKSGIIWWNLLDGWPQMSDAVVDYYLEKKLAYHYIKRSQAVFSICMGEIEGWNSRVYACNDSLKSINGKCVIINAETEEVVWERKFTAKENTTTLIGSIPLWYSERSMYIIKWESEYGSGKNHYLSGSAPIDLDWYVSLMKKWRLDCDESSGL